MLNLGPTDAIIRAAKFVLGYSQYFVELPKSTLRTCFFIAKKESFKFVQEQTVFDLSYLYQILLENKLLAAYEIKDRFYEAGSLTGIKELEYYLGQPLKSNSSELQ